MAFLKVFFQKTNNNKYQTHIFHDSLLIQPVFEWLMHLSTNNSLNIFFHLLAFLVDDDLHKEALLFSHLSIQ